MTPNCISLITGTGGSTSEILKVAIAARERSSGPFSPTFDVERLITEALTKILPTDAHTLCTDTLHISVTRVSDNENVILSKYGSKDDVIQVNVASKSFKT